MTISFYDLYGTESIFLEEKPEKRNGTADDDEAGYERRETVAVHSSDPPGIFMQYTTSEGLRKQAPLIDLYFERLKLNLKKISITYEVILDYIEEKMKKKEDERSTKAILSDLKAFEAFDAVLKDEIEVYVTVKLTEDFREHVGNHLKFVLKELDLLDNLCSRLPYGS